jgi:hypothetical protein
VKITDIDSSSVRGTGRSLAERWARSAVYALLGRLTRGSLCIEEGGERRYFGEDRHRAAIKATVQLKDAATYALVQAKPICTAFGTARTCCK